jgi:hypothetical protein
MTAAVAMRFPTIIATSRKLGPRCQKKKTGRTDKGLVPVEAKGDQGAAGHVRGDAAVDQEPCSQQLAHKLEGNLSCRGRTVVVELEEPPCAPGRLNGTNVIVLGALSVHEARERMACRRQESGVRLTIQRLTCGSSARLSRSLRPITFGFRGVGPGKCQGSSCRVVQTW